MEMQQVRYFIALARELNFTRAAEACNVSQPALTRAIQALEAELGGPLFHRERSQTHLSELGRMMAPYLESVLTQSETAKAQAQAFRKLENQQLKLGAMCTIGPEVLSDFIVQFHADHRDVALHVTDGSAALIPEQLLSGELEVGLYAVTGPLDERLHALPLFTERYVITLPPNHRLVANADIQLSDLEGEAYCKRTNCELSDSLSKNREQQGVNIRLAFSSERDEWVLGMVRAGLGFGFFPEFCTLPPEIVARPLANPIERTVSLVTVRGRPHSPCVGAFVRAAKAHAWPAAKR